MHKSRRVCGGNTIEVHLYGKLRRFAPSPDPTGDSIVYVPVEENDTILDVLVRLGVSLKDVGSNIFLNWQYSGLSQRIQRDDRLAVFPDDMQLLYKWYFKKIGAEENDQS